MDEMHSPSMIYSFRFTCEDAVSVCIFVRNAFLLGDHGDFSGLRWDPYRNDEEDNVVRLFGHSRLGHEVSFEVERFPPTNDMNQFLTGAIREVSFKKVADFGVVVHTEPFVLSNLLEMGSSPIHWDAVYANLQRHNSPQDNWHDFLRYQSWMRKTLYIPYGVLETNKHRYVRDVVSMPLPEVVPR